MFHSIRNEKTKNSDHYTVSPSLFEKQINFLKNKNFKFSRFEHLNGSEFSVAVTFDDGFRDNYDVALKLNSQKIPLTIFVVSDFVDDLRSEYLTNAQLKELASLEYVTIGAHGKTHQPLATMSEIEWKSEIRYSKAALENITGKEITSMSFPHGSYTEEMIQYAQSLGINKIGSSDIGINSSDVMPIKRIFILNWDSLFLFKLKLLGYWDWMSKI